MRLCLDVAQGDSLARICDTVQGRNLEMDREKNADARIEKEITETFLSPELPGAVDILLVIYGVNFCFYLRVSEVIDRRITPSVNMHA